MAGNILLRQYQCATFNNQLLNNLSGEKAGNINENCQLNENES
jgi:hypothetical protein